MFQQEQRDYCGVNRYLREKYQKTNVVGDSDNFEEEFRRLRMEAEIMAKDPKFNPTLNECQEDKDYTVYPSVELNLGSRLSILEKE